MEKKELFDNYVRNIARKYSRKCGMSFDDMYQELYLDMLSKGFNEETVDFKYLGSMLTNSAINICRVEGRRVDPLRSVDYENDLGNTFVSQEVSENVKTQFYSDAYEDVESEELIKSALDSLSERERKYVICKGYLAGIEFLEEEFVEVLKTLSDEDRNELLEKTQSSRQETYSGRYNDDLILKKVCGIKTGSNSGSARCLKNNLWYNLQKLGFAVR